MTGLYTLLNTYVCIWLSCCLHADAEAWWSIFLMSWCVCVSQEEAATVLTPVKKKIKNVGIFLKVRGHCVRFLWESGAEEEYLRPYTFIITYYMDRGVWATPLRVAVALVVDWMVLRPVYYLLSHIFMACHQILIKCNFSVHLMVAAPSDPCCNQNKDKTYNTHNSKSHLTWAWDADVQQLHWSFTYCWPLCCYYFILHIWTKK